MFVSKLLCLLCIMFVSSQYLSLGLSSNQETEADPDTLVLVHALFRHGNRTGQLSELYPKDPYLNYTYFPFGNGQLTNTGKMKEFSIGQALRKRYNKFLGSYFYPDIVDAFSTDYNRTKASLELVLASLFPPSGVQIWNPLFNWQPVSYNYFPVNKDKVLYGINCLRYKTLYNEVSTSLKQQAEYKKYENEFRYISENTGLNVTTFNDLYDLFFGLATEEEWGFTLPEWTKSVWPDFITSMAIKAYFVQTATTEMLQLASGYHLKKIINDTQEKIKNIDVEYGRKLYLYSAHENNLAQMLILLDVFTPPHVPTYGSYILLEVHNINGTYGIKLYYQHYVSKEAQQLKLPSCEEFCPFDEFVSIVNEYIPSEELCDS